MIGCPTHRQRLSSGTRTPDLSRGFFPPGLTGDPKPPSPRPTPCLSFRPRSVLLIRPKLPLKHQVVMTKALGGEHSNRYYEVCARERALLRGDAAR